MHMKETLYMYCMYMMESEVTETDQKARMSRHQTQTVPHTNLRIILGYRYRYYSHNMHKM